MKIIKVDTLIEANTFLRKLRGYMFTKQPSTREIMVFNNCNSIHTFNMWFKIDVLFLDHENRVIKKVGSLSKGRMLMPVKGASVVVEAPEGLFDSINENEIVAFDALSINK